MDVPSLDIVRKRHHTHRLPDAQPYARHDAPVEPLDPVLAVDVRERVHDRQFLRPVRR